MGAFSVWHWLIVLAIVLLLFGGGKIPRLMGDLAKGIKAFKSGLKDSDEAVENKSISYDGDTAAAEPAAKSKEAARG